MSSNQKKTFSHFFSLLRSSTYFCICNIMQLSFWVFALHFKTGFEQSVVGLKSRSQKTKRGLLPKKISLSWNDEIIGSVFFVLIIFSFFLLPNEATTTSFLKFFSPNRQSRVDYKSNPRSVSPSPIRYHSPGGLATHLSYKVTSKSSKEAASASSATSSSGLRLSNLTPPGSRKYGTYSMGGSNERSDSGYGGSGGNAAMLKTPPVGRKTATSDKGKLMIELAYCDRHLPLFRH